MSKERIKSIRSRIDTIDDHMLLLLNERASLAKEIAEVKSAAQQEDLNAVYHPDRESLVLARLKKLNEGPLTDGQVEQLFNEIKSCCLSLQQSLTVAYLGPRGTYTEAAAIKQFGHFCTTKSQASIDDVFHEVEAQHCQYGVVPVENSTEGVVNRTLDCLIEFKLKICAEIELPIHHAFLARPDTDPKSIKRIYSHQHSLAQCRRWLDVNYRDTEQVAVSSNAEAARLVYDERNTAAIAGTMAAEQYHLDVLERNIEDQTGNTTRFLVIGNHTVGATGNDKTSILVMGNDEPGALFKILGPFQEFDVNLCRIETRPANHSKWSYVFLMDIEGHESTESIRNALERIGDIALDVRSLGSYPKALSA
ncbi:MAG: prephenate dehydratase [Gammaproteobacteria bacterium]|nr:prephenate dehydratase [Gammaproteobacteria bacterium]